MGLLEEISEVFHLSKIKPIMHCKLFEDNNGALELAKAPKIRPRTKHISIKYHHFRAYVDSGKIENSVLFFITINNAMFGFILDSEVQGRVVMFPLFRLLAQEAQ